MNMSYEHFGKQWRRYTNLSHSHPSPSPSSSTWNHPWLGSKQLTGESR